VLKLEEDAVLGALWDRVQPWGDCIAEPAAKAAGVQQVLQTSVGPVSEEEQLFWTFVWLRQEAWHARFVEKRLWPWSFDHVLNTARFTNVYRCLDRGTQYLVEEVLEPVVTGPADTQTEDSMFALMVYRLFNKIETFEAVRGVAMFGVRKALEPGSLLHMYNCLKQAERAGPLHTGAYMCVSTPRVDPNGDRVADAVNQIVALAGAARLIGMHRRRGPVKLMQTYAIVSKVNGFGPFLSYMCATDSCWPLASLEGGSVTGGDVDSWVKCGPGAKKGLQLVTGWQPKAADEDAAVKRLVSRQQIVFAALSLKFRHLWFNGSPLWLSCLDVEHSLCEFHKYWRVLGGGHVKTRWSMLPESVWRPRCLTLPAYSQEV
jgi:hypothetical protein